MTCATDGRNQRNNNNIDDEEYDSDDVDDDEPQSKERYPNNGKQIQPSGVVWNY